MQEHFFGVDIGIHIDIDIHIQIDFHEEACLLPFRTELQPPA